MLIEHWVLAISGTVILICLALAYVLSSHWLIVVAIVGLNMVQAGFTGLCPIAITLKRLGVKSGAVFA
jgi:Protein of unknown function (DUF2892)